MLAPVSTNTLFQEMLYDQCLTHQTIINQVQLIDSCTRYASSVWKHNEHKKYCILSHCPLRTYTLHKMFIPADLIYMYILFK
jgi:hypothetical protein